jgi:hypothetical protein
MLTSLGVSCWQGSSDGSDFVSDVMLIEGSLMIAVSF